MSLNAKLTVYQRRLLFTEERRPFSMTTSSKLMFNFGFGNEILMLQIRAYLNFPPFDDVLRPDVTTHTGMYIHIRFVVVMVMVCLYREFGVFILF